MSTKRLFTSYSTRFCTILTSVILCSLAHSTTIVSIISKNGIVLLSDSKTTLAEDTSGDTMCRGVDTKKIFVVQERWGVAASDSTCFRYTVFQKGERKELAFDFVPWIKDLDRNLPKDISFDQFAQTIKDKFSGLIPRLQIVVADGGWGEPENPSEIFERLITFSITGYDSGVPRLSVVRFYIDWSTRTVLEPYLIPIKLKPIERGVNFNYAGISETVSDFLDPDSYAHQQAMVIDPETFTTFFSRRRLPTLDESVAIGLVLIEIEERIRPDVVGGAIRGVKISPDGKATEVEASARPSAPTRKQQKH